MDLKREIYLERIRPYYESELVKSIVGVRRSGKSTILYQIRDEILNQGTLKEDILFIDLEKIDFYLLEKDLFFNFISPQIRVAKKCYIFLDEVQRIESFEFVLERLISSFNCSIFVSTGTSKLLKGKIGANLVDKIIEFHINTFSYLEMLEYKNIDHSTEEFNDYLQYGGFPLRFKLIDREHTLTYLETITDGIIYKDILTTNKKDSIFKLEVVKYCLKNFGTYLSSEKVRDSLRQNHQKEIISTRTIDRVIEKLLDSSIISKVEKFDVTERPRLTTSKKFYLTDVSFKTLFFPNAKLNLELTLENIIYNELLSQDYKVFVGKIKYLDIDFVASKGTKKCFIQVTGTVSDEEVYEREFGVYKDLHDGSPRYVMSLDTILNSSNGIIHINIIDFLTHRVTLRLS